MRPSTDLIVSVTDANGTTATLSSDSPDPTYRPRGIQFGTQQGSGFYTGSFDISHPIDREHPAIHLRDKVQFVGVNGDIAYEGFVTDMPRSTTSDGQGILTVNLAGYMADTGRASFVMPFVDRDFASWGPMSTNYRATNAATFTIFDGQANPDTGYQQVMWTQVDGGQTGIRPWCATVYDAGPARIGRVFYTWSRLNIDNTDTNYWWDLKLGDANAFAPGAVDETGNLRAAGPAIGTLTATTSSRRYAVAEWFYATNASWALPYAILWSNLTVYGDHGLPLIGDTDPQGVAASDVIRYLIDTYCPKLNTGGVQDTTYPIAHLVFKDRTKVYDALLKINSFHLWQLAVWEGGTLHFGPVDMTSWDWEVRHDVRGTAIGLQGDSVENLRNGIVVQYRNVVTGGEEELHPRDHVELRDESLDNPWNQHGDEGYGEPVVLPFPTTEANALELGRLRLLEDNQAKAPGSFTQEHYVYDRAGVQQPAWKVRAGDCVRLTSTANLSDRPRLVVETAYSGDSKTVTIGVDSTLRVLDALVDRTLTALSAANLG